jgi:hypothetical protein
LTAQRCGFNFICMDNKQPRNTTATQNKARDQKRAEALRQNLLKRKQQSRIRDSQEKK